MFITALSIIENGRKLNIHQLMINKMLYIHTMEYCLITTRNEVLIHTTTQTNFENIILTKESTPRRPHMIPFIQNVQNRQIHRGKSRLVVS